MVAAVGLIRGAFQLYLVASIIYNSSEKAGIAVLWSRVLADWFSKGGHSADWAAFASNTQKYSDRKHPGILCRTYTHTHGWLGGLCKEYPRITSGFRESRDRCSQTLQDIDGLALRQVFLTSAQWSRIKLLKNLHFLWRIHSILHWIQYHVF